MQWLDHPMTQLVFRVLQDHRDSSEKMIMELMMNSRSVADVDLHQCSQLKGQVFAFDEVLNIHDFLEFEDLQTLEEDTDVGTNR